VLGRAQAMLGLKESIVGLCFMFRKRSCACKSGSKSVTFFYVEKMT
jgi:hypothetical protein